MYVQCTCRCTSIPYRPYSTGCKPQWYCVRVCMYIVAPFLWRDCTCTMWGFNVCRIVQWRHQVLRRKGYLKFYRRMRNVRRVPFIVVSIGKATWGGDYIIFIDVVGCVCTCVAGCVYTCVIVCGTDVLLYFRHFHFPVSLGITGTYW